MIGSRWLWSTLILLIASTLWASAPGRVSFDAQCFKIDGKDTFIYSGAFHYFRCPKALWASRFQRIKNAGFNTVETYVAWNESERTAPRGLDDFSHVNLDDLDTWLTMASKRFGLNVIVRPGPYICAEWDMGGYPAWLLSHKPKRFSESPNAGAWLRSDDPTYLAWCRHWYRAVIPVIARHQISRMAPHEKGVILVQIENEYDFASGSDAVHLAQLHELAKDARSGGIDVPLITCWTHQIRTTTDPLLKGVIDCDNFYPRWDVEGIRGPLQRLRREQSTKPMLVTEMQGGWFSEVGGKLAEDQDGISAAQIRNLVLYSIQNGLSGLNYYMLFGGTNFGDRTPPNITTSYDYFAPIREDGSVADKYAEVAGIGQFLARYGPAIVRSSPAKPLKFSNENIEAAVRRAPDGTQFVFVRNRSHTASSSGNFVEGRFTREIELAPFASYVIVVPPGPAAVATWWPKPPAPHTVARFRPTPIVDAFGRPDNGVKDGLPTDLAPSLDNQYVLYRSLVSHQADDAQLSLKVGAGSVLVFFDGAPQQEAGKHEGRPFYELPKPIERPRSLRSGTPPPTRIDVLYESPGRPNGGMGMEEDHGLLGSKVSSGIVADQPLTDWTLKPSSLQEAQNSVDAPDGGPGSKAIQLVDGQWQPELSTNNAVGVYRTSFHVDAQVLASHEARLVFPGIDDFGWIYLNGHKIGETYRWDEVFSQEVSALLKPGENRLAVIVKNNTGEGGIYRVPSLVWQSRAPASESGPLRWQICDLAGRAGHWDTPTASDKGWHRVSLNASVHPARKIAAGTAAPLESDSPTVAMAYWYHLDFTLDTVRDSESLRLDALGNGFISLNGHPLGRYWQVGPQREYYLPPCWLRKGHNWVTVMLRPVDGYALIHSASIAQWGR